MRMQVTKLKKVWKVLVLVLFISSVLACDACGGDLDELQEQYSEESSTHRGNQRHGHQHHGHEHQHHDKHNSQYQQHNQDSQKHQPIQQQRPLSKQPIQSESPSKQPQLQMIEDKPRLLETLKLTPITIFFYGTTSSPQYQQFLQLIPAYNSQFFSQTPFQLQFAYISSDKFKLARPNPSLSIYRNINNGEWLIYRGIFQKSAILKWVTENILDPLKELTGDQLDDVFVSGKNGFILLDFGQFYLLKPKIMISQFCRKFELTCGKISHTNKALNMIIQLMRAQNQPGIPKLSYWNPKTQQLQIYTKDVGHITGNFLSEIETQLMQLYSGHESVIPYESELDVAKVIHPETQIIQVKPNDPNSQL